MRQYHTYSTELKLKTVKEYLSSGLSQKKFAEKAGINFHTLNSWIDKYRQCGPERKQFGVNQKENLIPISTIMEDTDMRLGITGLRKIVKDMEPRCLYVFCGTGKI